MEGNFWIIFLFYFLGAVVGFCFGSIWKESKIKHRLKKNKDALEVKDE